MLKTNRNKSDANRDANSLLVTGIVTEVNPELMYCRVNFPERDLASWELQILQHSAYQNKDYWMPDVGELVLVALDENTESGYVLGSLYNQTDTPPRNNKDERALHFPDGSYACYNRESHTLDIHVKGKIRVFSDGQPCSFEFAENLTIRGKKDVRLSASNNLKIRSGGDTRITSDGVLINEAIGTIYSLSETSNVHQPPFPPPGIKPSTPPYRIQVVKLNTNDGNVDAESYYDS